MADVGESVKLVDSLLEAISRLEGDALIMHVGEKPYVVTTSASMNAFRGPVAWGHVELSSRVLTTEAVLGMLEQLLPADQRQALDDYGAIEFELPDSGPSSDRFTIIAARGGDDVWLEVKRTPALVPPAEAIEEPLAEAAPAPIERAPAASAAEPIEEAPAPVAPVEVPVEAEAAAQPPSDAEPIAEQPVVAEPPAATPVEVERPAPPVAVEAVAAAESTIELEPPVEIERPVETPAEVETVAEQPAQIAAVAPALDVPVEEAVVSKAPVEIEAAPEPVPEFVEPPEPFVALEADAHDSVPFEVVEEEPQLAPTHAEVEALLTSSASTLLSSAAPVEAEARQAVVLPLSRSPISAEPPSEVRTAAGSPLERVLRIAAARGAATVYVVAHSQPVIRVDGEISVLDGEPVLTAAEVERLVMDLAPARARDSAPTGEWMADVPDVGRVRCVTFRDHRGPGVIFRMIPPKGISADQLGLSPEVQALCAQPDGLVLVTGARASGKSTLLSAFVDLINRTRSDHVITIESQIGFVHESRRSFVSQREVRGVGETAAGAIRSALREDPDVLVLEDMRTPEIVSVALEAAESGRLVFASVSAPLTVAALERLIEMFPADRRAQAQTSLAGALRGVVAQTLLRKVRGGRIAAREILLNTPAVASLILEGKTFQLPVALDSGRRHGMMPLADAMAALVRDGTVHAAEAYRKAPDRAALLAALRRDGVDTSFAERLA